MSPAIGAPAPAFTLPTTSGEPVSVIPGVQGPAVVAFWCNHCPYVRAWEGRFDALAREYGERIPFVAVNANDAQSYPADSFEAMTERMAETGFVFHYAHDAEQAVAKAYGAERTPEVFVIDAAGRVRYHGAIDDSREPADVSVSYLRDAIEATLAGEAPPVTETAPVGCTIKWRR